VHEDRRQWDEGTKQLAIKAVDEFKILVRAVPTWSQTEDAKLQALVSELDPGESQPPPPQQPRRPDALDTGTRAFIGREGASVASVLDQTAKSLQQDAATRDPLKRVLAVMQPLRGLAMLAELPPMADLLEGIERAVGEITGHEEPVPDAALLFNAAARALSRASREISTEGQADADAEETLDFARRLGAILDLDRDLQPIESLYHDDDGPHVVERSTAAVRPGQLGQLELVSHGEHLRLAADELERGRSAAQRELRAQALAATFRALAGAGGDPLQDAVAQFAAVARQAVASGAAVQRTADFAAQLREAAAALAESDPGTLAAVTAALGGPPAAAPAPSPVTAEPVAPAPSAAPTAEPVAPAAAPPGEEPADLAGSWARFERYAEALGLGTPSVDELLAGPPGDPALAAPAEVLVSIADLCYSGQSAVDRALEIRAEIRAALGHGAGEVDIRDLIEEAFDLFELGVRQQ
jgi:hypothetical protein